MTTPEDVGSERGAERRLSTWHALWAGNFERRRRNERRSADRRVTGNDWHHPQWLAVTMLILILCVTDAVFTLTLLDNGGWELNPLMRSLLADGGRGFTYWKLGLTSGGVVMLVILVRMRAFGRLPVGQILYLVLFGYTALVGYEYWLLSTQVDQVEPNAVTLSQGS